MIPNEKLELFKKRVASGQSLMMIKWEFKLTEEQVRKLCKEHNLLLNTTDYLAYSSKMVKREKGRR